MIFRDQQKNRKTSSMIAVGMALLLVGLMSPYAVHPSTQMGRNLFEGIRGVLMGASIGVNLFAVILGARTGGCSRS